ncbi:MAG: Ig domain-containing protein [Eubacterium sp.]|nr:Ig-like domain-containing protein [uncultured Schaedlerella sp.]MCI9127660.1 Ig domain-containing protein [Eubacterium sp.]
MKTNMGQRNRKNEVQYDEEKYYFLAISLMLLVFSTTTISFAHSGRTDSNGGHHDYKNKSGLGSYHYHHGMEAHLHPGGVCPYGYNSQPDVYTEYTPPSPSISLNSYPTNLYVGESAGIDFSVNNATNNLYSVTSSNPEIVKVNPDNTLTAMGEGVSTITVSGSGAAETFTLEVRSIPVEGVNIANQIERLQLGETHRLEWYFEPANATTKEITWTSSDSNILEIDSNGNISAKSVGNAVISFNASNNISGEFSVEVYEVYPEQIITNVDNINLEIGKAASLNIQILPENTNNTDCDIVVENQAIANIDENLAITPISDGNTKITIKTCNNIVKEIPISVFHIPVENISIDDSSIEYITMPFSDKAISYDSSIELNASIEPLDASIKDLEWESSNPDVISVKGEEFIIKGTGEVTLKVCGYDDVEESISFHVVNPNKIIGVVSAGALGVGCAGAGVGFLAYKKRSKWK